MRNTGPILLSSFTALALLSGVLTLLLVENAAPSGDGDGGGPKGVGSTEPSSGAARSEEIGRLRRQLEKLKPRGYYILIDTAANRLYFKKDNRVLLDAVCSTGSGRRLVAGNQQWSFRTPHGEFRIIAKARNPIWRKPDWAFLEEGEPIPVNQADRYEPGVLGEYALALGNGYFIHGTLYNRLLGKNVTHGCIRLGSKDLIYLSKTAPIGTRVFIY